MSGLKDRFMPMRSDVDFVTEHPVPEAALEGRVQGAQTAPFVILERPNVLRRPFSASPSVDRRTPSGR